MDTKRIKAAITDTRQSPFASTEEAYAATVALCKKMGMPVNLDVDPNESVMWTGTEANLKDLTPENVLHELAHWVLASEEQKKVPDFGLGRGPDSAPGFRSGIETPVILPDSEVDNQEGASSLLGILYCLSLSLPTLWTARSHSWLDYHDRWVKEPDVDSAFQYLREKKCVNQKGEILW